jgi:hypothetical protein
MVITNIKIVAADNPLLLEKPFQPNFAILLKEINMVKV